MCGITGVFGNKPFSSEIVEKAAGLQSHRGPDHFESLHSDTYCFCHNRLSIIDVSARSNQPLQNDYGILVYNGEIYNYRELSDKVLDSPHAFSDTVTLLTLLTKKDRDIIPRLDGMFAFAFYDREKNSLLLSRDRAGIKPLYYAVRDGLFFFASEIKTVLNLLENCTSYSRQNDLSDSFVNSMISYGHAEFGLTPFKSVHELPAGTMLSWSPGKPETAPVPFFALDKAITGHASGFLRGSTLTDAVSSLDTLLTESVGMHLLSDVPVGILCSGGIDSSLITAIAARKQPGVRIFHATSDSGPGELPFARMVAKKYSLELSTIAMSSRLYREALVDCTWHLDVPHYHPSDISLYTISKQAREQGIKALLCGEGADELFGGYGWHRFFRNALKNHAATSFALNVVNKLLRGAKVFGFSDQFEKDDLLLYSGNYFTYSNQNLPVFAKRNSIRNMHDSWQLLCNLREAYKRRDSEPDLAAFITSNMSGHLGSLLQRNDRMCMMAGIESRVPFIENNIIDFALNLDSSYKLRGNQGKFLLKKVAERYLPRAVIYRKKAGFPLPWETYCSSIPMRLFDRGFISGYFNCSSSDIALWTKGSSSIRFTAIALEIWGRLFVAGESPSSIKSLLE